MKIIRRIIDFHKDLINSKTVTSHRRYLSIFFAYNAAIIAYISLWIAATNLNKVPPVTPSFTGLGEIIIYFLSTSLLFAGLTTLSANAALKAKSDVASEVVKNDAADDTNQVAKDIVQSDKPE